MNKIPEIFNKDGKPLDISAVITPFWLWLVRKANIEVIDAENFIEVHGFAEEGDNMVPVISFAELLELYKTMEQDFKYIDYEGYRYWYEHRPAKHKVDICLATEDPEKYCNGFYLYSDKDPGSGKCFVVVKTDNPNANWMENYK